ECGPRLGVLLPGARLVVANVELAVDGRRVQLDVDRLIAVDEANADADPVRFSALAARSNGEHILHLLVRIHFLFSSCGLKSADARRLFKRRAARNAAKTRARGRRVTTKSVIRDGFRSRGFP